MQTSLLEMEGIRAGYGRSQVLFDMRLKIEAEQCITLLGRNGMGKSTTVKCLMGLLAPTAGHVLWHGRDFAGQPAYRIARAGIGLVPEGRQIFPNLSVRENLVATAANRRHAANPWTLERVYGMFPRLEERSRNFGNQLSGGEQQMLAIGRALMTNPELLVLDEATEGLSPLIRQEIWAALRALRTQGMAILVIDKNLASLLQLADYHYILEKGSLVWEGNSKALEGDTSLWRRYLGA